VDCIHLVKIGTGSRSCEHGRKPLNFIRGTGNFLISWVTISFSRRILHHELITHNYSSLLEHTLHCSIRQPLLITSSPLSCWFLPPVERWSVLIREGEGETWEPPSFPEFWYKARLALSYTSRHVRRISNTYFLPRDVSSLKMDTIVPCNVKNKILY
jgi:hypothetical protein